MGISLVWAAVQGIPASAVLERLAMKATGAAARLPTGRGELAMQRLPHDWTLVAANGCGHRIGQASSMEALSAGCRGVSCAIEEHVNFASTELWENGKCVWHVSFEGGDENESVVARGELPALYHALLASAEPEDSSNAEGHFPMDIPQMLADDLIGARQDTGQPAIDELPYEKLQDLQRRPWWRIWGQGA